MSIVIDQLSFAYRGWPVLHNITATAGRGRVVAVIGPNAAGKSTLLRCVIGALRPRSGCVLIDGQPAHLQRTRWLAQRIAYVSQRSIVSAAFSVKQVVELGRYALPPGPGRINEALFRLELSDIADRPYHELSVGQQQRVAMARAFAQLGPNGHLILDEPTSAMDLRHCGQCLRLLRDLAEKGVTVIVAMHDLRLAASFADDAWLLDTGRLVASGSVEIALKPDQLGEVFGVRFEWLEQLDGQRHLHAILPVKDHPAKMSST